MLKCSDLLGDLRQFSLKSMHTARKFGTQNEASERTRSIRRTLYVEKPVDVKLLVSGAKGVLQVALRGVAEQVLIGEPFRAVKSSQVLQVPTRNVYTRRRDERPRIYKVREDQQLRLRGACFDERY